MIRISWTDKNGASKVRGFRNVDDAAAFLSTLRAEAIARNDAGEVVGGVEDGHASIFTFRDLRRRWLWWLDA